MPAAAPRAALALWLLAAASGVSLTQRQGSLASSGAGSERLLRREPGHGTQQDSEELVMPDGAPIRSSFIVPSRGTDVEDVAVTDRPSRLPGEVCFITNSCQEDPRDDFGGLAAYVTLALGQIKRCLRWGKKPLVHWGESFHAPCGGNGNCWEQVFEQLTPREAAEGRGGVCMTPWTGGFLTAGMHLQQVAEDAELRTSTGAILRDHVRLRPALRQRVDAFEAANFNGYHILGVHVRATDYSMEYGEHLVTREQWIDQVRSRLERLPRPRRVFVASDNTAMIDALRQTFGEEAVLSTDALRAKGGRDGESADWFHCKGSVAEQFAGNRSCLVRQWEGVLMDTWLLSRCKELLGWEGSVSKLALMLSPGMPFHSVAPGRDPSHRADGGRLSLVQLSARGTAQARRKRLRCGGAACSKCMGKYGLRTVAFEELEDEASEEDTPNTHADADKL